jgi:hypothetical protein
MQINQTHQLNSSPTHHHHHHQPTHHQNAYGVNGDQSCVEPHKPCEQDPSQALCARKHQIRHFKVDAKSATGKGVGKVTVVVV